VVEEVSPGRPNLIATFKGNPRGPKRALQAHLDTVDIDGMEIPPFEPSVKEGRLYGRGSADTKGPMTAMLTALLRAKAKGTPLNGDWFFIATCDEELGGAGAKCLMQQGFRCDGIIVAEPTELKLIDAHKGVERYLVQVTGKATHSAYPELGINAISALSELIVQLNTLTAEEANLFKTSHAIGPLTISVGTIQGGDQVNRVPQYASAEIDFRLPPELPEGSVLKILKQSADLISQRFPGIQINWEQSQHYPPLHPQPDSAFSQDLQKLAAHHLGNSSFEQVRYATDAGFFASEGVPSIVFGPGSISEAHTARESIDLKSMEDAAHFLEKIITDPIQL